jgi:TRAP-type mannitol/chloroaromatic compound transport system permease small subunit
MRRKYLAIASRLDSITLAFCLVLLALMATGQLLVIVLRFAFNVGSLPLQDLTTYCFATLCVLAIPLATRRSAHVCVDLFRSRPGTWAAYALEYAGTAFVLLVFGIVLVLSLSGVVDSWKIFEASPQIGGLPGYFLVRTFLPVSFLLTILQGISVAISRSLSSSSGGFDGC